MHQQIARHPPQNGAPPPPRPTGGGTMPPPYRSPPNPLPGHPGGPPGPPPGPNGPMKNGGGGPYNAFNVSEPNLGQFNGHNNGYRHTLNHHDGNGHSMQQGGSKLAVCALRVTNLN